jgi:polyvinyl alcohol dehydrogenase (cytochrome)
MAALRRRLTGATLLLLAGLHAAGPDRARAQEAASAPPPAGACPAPGAAFDPTGAPHWNGWGAGPAQLRFQPSGMAGLAAADVPRLRLRWAFGFPGTVRAYAQPTVAGGRVFVGSQGGRVYSLDAAGGCTHWEYAAGAPVRTAIAIGQRPDGWSAYFGDQRGTVHAVDAVTGRSLWRTLVEDHPAAIITGAPLLVGETLFVPVSSFEEFSAANPGYPCCSFRGSLVALEAATGGPLWKAHTIAQEPGPGATGPDGRRAMGPSGAAIWSSPTYDAARRAVYVATGDNYSDPPTDTSDAVLAFDGDTGRLLWSRQITAGDAYNISCVVPGRANCPGADGPDHDFGASAILVELPGGRRVLLAGQKSGVVTALDPDREGAILWQRRVGAGGRLGGVQWGMATDGSRLYVAVSDVRAERVAPGTPGAQISALDPRVWFLLDGGVGGGLHALELETGEEVWRTPHPGCGGVPGCSPAQSAAVTAIPGVVFSGGLDGRLRAYSAADGRILWDVDTKGEHRTVNGVAARGGSIDGPGAVVVGGLLHVGSGSGYFGTMPGNVLLTYSVEGR